jgi:autotransporter translocation and assembly factor TamB
VTLDFPSIFLANAPQFFHPEIFHDGVLSGTLSLSETLQHPRITGEAQLVNGKLQNAPLDLTEANGRATFNGNRASLDFFNAATKDVDLSFLGEIDFHDTSDIAIKIAGATPIFDLTLRPIDCVGKIEMGAVSIALAPAVAEMEFRGGLFQSGWTIGLKERISAQSFGALDRNETVRKFPLCFSSTTAAEKTLFLGAPGRPEARRETAPSKKRGKKR